MDSSVLFEKRRYTYEELLACGNRENDLLPLPPMLMFDRITDIDPNGGSNGKGIIVAELDIYPDLWFFPCHFKGDPVMPGCLELDALWQLLGFYQGHRGARGYGRALGLGELKFSGQIRPTMKLVRYSVSLTSMRLTSKLSMAKGEGTVFCDDKIVCEVRGLHVGVLPELPKT